VLTRKENLPPSRTENDALGFLRYLASQAHLQAISCGGRFFPMLMMT
jgi:hypothetical protein